MLEIADCSLERTINALHEAHGTGGYRWSAFVFADDRNANLIAGSLVGVLAGSRTKDQPFNRFNIVGAGPELLLGNESLLDLVQEAAPILPLSRACEALLLPEAELPGIRLRRNVFLGRTFSPFRPREESKSLVSLGPDAFSALGGNQSPDLIQIPGEDLFRHILVAGTTGSGKTRRVFEILNNLADGNLSVVVFETAKRTYREVFRRKDRKPPVVYSLGSSVEYSKGRFHPLRINPFYFELGTSLKRHIAVLSDALAELMPTQAMIAPLMRRAVEDSYVERGWDIELGRNTSAENPVWPSVVDFAAHVRQVAQTLNYGPEVTANYQGALESRAALFLGPTFQDIFAHGGNIPIDSLFPPGRDAIVEVEELPPSEVDIRAFVMTLLLSRLRAVQAVRPSHRSSDSQADISGKQRRWLVVIEEAHNVLDRSFEERRPADESNAGRTLLRCISRLLQEGREMELGVMVVDQSPMSLARSVIANTGTKIVMRLEDGAEMEEIGTAMGLEEDAWKKLGYLGVGEAVVKASFMDTPVKTAPYAQAKPDSMAEAPPAPATVPRYGALDRLWKPVLTGTRIPDETWQTEMMETCDGNVARAAFVGAKALLELNRNQADVVAKTRDLRGVLASTRSNEGDLFGAAWRLSVAANGQSIGQTARLMFRALVTPADLDPTIQVTSAGIRCAAEFLAKAGIGICERWVALLLALAGVSKLPWLAACEQFNAYCGKVGQSDETAVVRLLLLHSETLRGSFGEESAFDPIDLVLRARALVQQLTKHDTGNESPEVAARWRVLEEHCRREAALDMASRHGDAARRKVETILNQEMTSYA